MMLAVVACGNGNNGSDNGNGNSSKGSLRVAVIPVEECLPLLVAEKLGLLDSTEADVKLMRYRALSECQEAMKKHEVDAMPNDSAIGFKFLTSKKARIHRLSQLSDKVIATDKVGYAYNLAKASIDSLLKQDRHVFIIQVNDIDVRTKMLTTSNVDAALLPEPNATEAIKQGAYEIKLPKEITGNAGLAHSLLTKSTPKLDESLKTALDSIKQYGKENYYYLLDY